MKRQLSHAAFDQLRDTILSGKLAAGAPLSEVRLGQELGMSRSPIRTALEQLTSIGLVNHLPGKGYFVSEVSVARITSVMEVREALESFAAARGNFDESHAILAKLRSIFKFFAELSRDPVAREWAILSEADQRFHLEIISSLNNPVAHDIVEQLSLSLVQVRRIAWGSVGRFRSGAAEHLGIIDALIAGDADVASQLVGTHISRAKELLVQLMSARTPASQIPISSERARLDCWLRSDDPEFSSVHALLAADDEASSGTVASRKLV